MVIPVYPLPNGGHVRILVAEDERINQLYLSHLLRDAGHDVVLATSGTEVLEALRESPADLVLMDIQMPDMDGLEATRRIRSGEVGDTLRDLPVIALTAYASSAEEAKFAESGVQDSVAKPFNEPHLLALIERYGGTSSDPRG